MRLHDFLKLKRYTRADLVRSARAAGHRLWPSEVSDIVTGLRPVTPAKRPAVIDGLLRLADVSPEEVAQIDELCTGGEADGASKR